MVVSELIEKYGVANLGNEQLLEVVDGKNIPSDKQEKYRLQACSEMCKRILSKKKYTQKSMANPSNVIEYLMPQMCSLEHEEFWVMTLTSKNKLIRHNVISTGSLTNTVVHPREVFRPAFIDNAASVIVAHNHPSGNPYPSDEDKKITEFLKKAGETLQIPMLDHVIIGGNDYYSFQQEKKL